MMVSSSRREMSPPGIHVSQSSVNRKPLSLQAIQRYGLAVVSVSLALGLALLLNRFHFRDAAVPLYLFAGALTAWYGGVGPALLSLALSYLTFDYFFVEPLYEFNIAAVDLPYFIIFVAFDALVIWFSTIRRRVEEDLRQTRDNLQIEVAERTQQANLLNLTHDSIFVRDMNFIVTYWNRGAQELYGWAAEEATGTQSQALLKTTFPIPLEDIREELFRSGRWDGELRRTRKDGSEVVVASRWSLRRDEQHRPVAILETSNDVTDRRRREQEIEHLNRELATRSLALEASNKELEAFAYSISHDLRAPLRHMSGFTELLQKSTVSSLNEKSQRYVTMIMEAAKRMGTLIDDLLSFSRIGRAEAHKSMVSLDQLVQEALSEVKQDTSGRNVAWKVGELPILYGDRSMLRLVMVNLISNAVKFTRTRPQAEIEIGCKDDNQQNEAVVFIRDNGVGFDMKYVNKLFGVFQRLHRADAFEGTGIGLATVQRIVHRHGGRAWAEGAVEGGATFYFSLSKAKGEPAYEHLGTHLTG
jgi:PAS domain S-box-containing protein